MDPEYQYSIEYIDADGETAVKHVIMTEEEMNRLIQDCKRIGLEIKVNNLSKCIVTDDESKMG